MVRGQRAAARRGGAPRAAPAGRLDRRAPERRPAQGARAHRHARRGVRAGRDVGRRGADQSRRHAGAAPGAPDQTRSGLRHRHGVRPPRFGDLRARHRTGPDAAHHRGPPLSRPPGDDAGGVLSADAREETTRPRLSPPPRRSARTFVDALRTADHVVAVVLSKALSGTYGSAERAAKESGSRSRRPGEQSRGIAHRRACWCCEASSSRRRAGTRRRSRASWTGCGITPAASSQWTTWSG